VSLVCKLEFLLVIDTVKSLIFLNVWFSCVWNFGLDRFGADLIFQIREISKQLVAINFTDKYDRDVGVFMLESSMNEHTAVYLPASMTETLDCLELVPFRRLRIVYFHRYVFTNIICTPTDYHHQRAEEQSGMLVAWRWGHFILVWRLDPVPATVSVPS